MLKAVSHSKNEDSKSVTVYYNNEAAVDWYKKYEHLDILYIIGVRIIAEVMESQVQVKQARILDVAAGTGLTGIEVTKLGFENIDALEPSEEMLKKLPRNVYKNIYKEALDPVKQSSIPNNSYDCLVSTGSVLEGHIEGAHFSEFVRILKPGGLIIFNVSDRYSDFRERLEDDLQALMEDGSLESVTKQRSVYFYNFEDANIYTIRTA
ncbi:methyltransferase-like protein 27 [Amphiura filiformis]|uniref:methyltransferase-like protein 27 n=1 Tax=Amphiura filiformis TaxID=82378 RepID=UPI003B21194C